MKNKLCKSRKGVLWVRRRRNLKNRKITAMCMVRDIIMGTAMNTSMSRKRAKGTVMSIITLIPMSTAMNIVMNTVMVIAMNIATQMERGRR